MRKKLIIENYIEIDGEDVLMDSLPEEQQKKIKAMLQGRMMEAAGFKRKETTG